MDVKKRFKLYKSGKRWVALALLFGGTAFFIETNQTVANADESVAQTSVQSEPDNSLQVQTEDKQESADQKDSSEAKQPVQSDSQQSTAAEETQEKAATTEETEKAASQSTPKAASQSTVSTPTEQTLSQKNNPAVTTQPKKTGFQKSQDEKKTYYYDGSGNMVHGQQNINGKWYLFDEQTGEMKTGFQYISSQKKKVYYSNAGQMQYGQQHIDRYWYLFDNFTGAMQTGFQYIANQRKVVYYNNAGQMQYGRQKISGRTYDMNRMTGAVSHGSGQQNIGGKWYLFNKNGTARTGFQWIANQKKTVYYNNKGEMQYGQQRIGNGWYLFSWGTGAMQTGFKDLKSYGQNKVVYYADNGQMQYRWQVIGHDQYYFDTSSGARYAGRRKIGNRWYSFNGNGTLKCFTARVLNWFFNRRGKLTYSMYGSRTGADGTADCSGSMVAALRGAGASRPAYTYNTESIHPYLKSNGYYLAREGRDVNYVPQYGDIVIWGKKGYSGGGGGHIMIMSSAGSDAKCISTCGYYWDKNPNSIYGARGQAVQEFKYKWYHGTHNNMYYYVYRPYDLRRS